MKYSLHLRAVSHKYLQKADEIMVEYRDRKAIPDYAKKYPQRITEFEAAVSECVAKTVKNIEKKQAH